MIHEGFCYRKALGFLQGFQGLGFRVQGLRVEGLGFYYDSYLTRFTIMLCVCEVTGAKFTFQGDTVDGQNPA